MQQTWEVGFLEVPDRFGHIIALYSDITEAAVLRHICLRHGLHGRAFHIEVLLKRYEAPEVWLGQGERVKSVPPAPSSATTSISTASIAAAAAASATPTAPATTSPSLSKARVITTASRSCRGRRVGCRVRVRRCPRDRRREHRSHGQIAARKNQSMKRVRPIFRSHRRSRELHARSLARGTIRVSIPAPVMVGGGVGEAEVVGIHDAGEVLVGGAVSPDGRADRRRLAR